MKGWPIISSQKQREREENDDIRIHRNATNFLHKLCWVKWCWRCFGTVRGFVWSIAWIRGQRSPVHHIVTC